MHCLAVLSDIHHHLSKSRLTLYSRCKLFAAYEWFISNKRINIFEKESRSFFLPFIILFFQNDPFVSDFINENYEQIVIFIKVFEKRLKILLNSFLQNYFLNFLDFFFSYSRHVEVDINIKISFKVDFWYPNVGDLEVDVCFSINDAAHTRLFPHLSCVLLGMLNKKKYIFSPFILDGSKYWAQDIIFWESLSLCTSSQTEQSDKQ